VPAFVQGKPNFFQSPYHLYFWKPIFWNIGNPKKDPRRGLTQCLVFAWLSIAGKAIFCLTKKLCFSVDQKVGLGLPSQP